jgi:D-sedoheptulose 7-phosphate isomerase
MTTEPTGFLYPFIESEERDEASLISDLIASAHAKFAISRDLRLASLMESDAALRRAASEMSTCFRDGGRLLAFGNGGSATDADSIVALFRHPPSGQPLAAMSLAADTAVLTALSNDVGFELVFSRQIIAHGRTGDVAVGFSTSGDSVNILRALDEADRRGMLTIGFSGYEGGAMAAAASLRHCLVVHSDSVHRVQETQDALMFALWSGVQGFLEGNAV